MDLVFPKECAGCNKEGQWLCPDCREQIKFFFPQTCLICDKEVKEGILCRKCSPGRHLKNIIPIMDYNNEIVASVIKYWKYYFIKDISRDLAHVIVRHLEHQQKGSSFLYKYINSSSTLLIPVPLHPKRLKRRGFNQATEVAESLSEYFDLPLSCQLHRIQNKKPQTKLSGKERENNLKNCFAWKGGDLSGYKVVLIDDVVTTGATMFECASTLKANGAKNILGLAVARG